MTSIKLPGRVAMMLLLMFIVSAATPKIMSAVDTHAKVKTIFIYNFSKYIEWPVAMHEGDFVVGIYGDYPAIYEELSKMARSKKVGSQNFKIVKYNTISDIKKCHILYIVSDKSKDLPKVITKLKGKNTLIVTDSEGLARRGAAINFYNFQSKQRMEINPRTIQKYKLKVSGQLLALSKVIK